MSHHITVRCLEGIQAIFHTHLTDFRVFPDFIFISFTGFFFKSLVAFLTVGVGLFTIFITFFFNNVICIDTGWIPIWAAWNVLFHTLIDLACIEFLVFRGIFVAKRCAFFNCCVLWVIESAVFGFIGNTSDSADFYWCRH